MTQTRAGTAASGQRLVRRADGQMLSGVAAGLSDYLDVDVTLVRAGFVVLALMGGLGVPLYVAGWLLMPPGDAGPSVAEELLGRARWQ